MISDFPIARPFASKTARGAPAGDPGRAVLRERCARTPRAFEGGEIGGRREGELLMMEGLLQSDRSHG